MILLGSFFCERKENEVVHWFLRILERNHCWKSRDWSRSCQVRFLLFSVFLLTFNSPLFSSHLWALNLCCLVWTLRATICSVEIGCLFICSVLDFHSF